jgi:hypothetical protein
MFLVFIVEVEKARGFAHTKLPRREKLWLWNGLTLKF